MTLPARVWSTQGLPCTTFKLGINHWEGEDGRVVRVRAYFHLFWKDESKTVPVGIDFDGLNAEAGVAKAALRELCRELTVRMSEGQIDLGYMAQRWIAQRFEPAGYCEQVNGNIKSVLDGFARVLNRRFNLEGVE